MEAFNLRKYLAYAILMIRSNTIVLWCLGLIGLCSATAILLRDTSFHWPLNSLTIGLSIAATPVFYGIYYELIEDTYSSIGQIARKYVLNYIWLLIRMYLPAVCVAMLPLFLIPGNGGSGYFEITLIFFSLIYIYVIPFYYISGRQLGAISQGISFLLNNLVASTPLIFTVLLLEAVMLLIQNSKAVLIESTTISFALLDFFVYFAASLVDFAVFIILIFILKNAAPGEGNNSSPKSP